MTDSSGTTPPAGLRLTPRITLPETLVEWSYAASSGPGGQGVNKRATKCTLRVRLADIPFGPAQLQRLRTLASLYLTDQDELVISSDEHRSQHRNRDACVEKLAALVLEASVLPKVRRKTRPGRGAIERRLKEKHVRSDRKKSRRAEE
jgi:ribosome-associated protein